MFSEFDPWYPRHPLDIPGHPNGRTEIEFLVAAQGHPNVDAWFHSCFFFFFFGWQYVRWDFISMGEIMKNGIWMEFLWCFLFFYGKKSIGLFIGEKIRTGTLYGRGTIPIFRICLGALTYICKLFWCEQKRYTVFTHPIYREFMGFRDYSWYVEWCCKHIPIWGILNIDKRVTLLVYDGDIIVDWTNHLNWLSVEAWRCFFAMKFQENPSRNMGRKIGSSRNIAFWGLLMIKWIGLREKSVTGNHGFYHDVFWLQMFPSSFNQVGG